MLFIYLFIALFPVNEKYLFFIFYFFK